MSLADRDKAMGVAAARHFAELGFEIVATAGTAASLEAHGVPVRQVVSKLEEDRARRGRADRLGPDPPRDQLAPGPRPPRRRRPHPPGRHPLPGAAADHRRRRAGGRGRAWPSGPATASPCARCRSCTPAPSAPATTSSACRSDVAARRRGRAGGPGHEVDLATSVGSVALPNPVMTAAGTSGHGAELAPVPDLSPPRGGGRQVAGGRSRGPATPLPALHATARGHAQLRGAAGPGRRGVAARRPARRCGRPAPGSWRRIWGRTVEDFERAAELLAGAGPEVVAVEVNVSCPNLEDRNQLFAHSPEATAAAVVAAVGGRRPAPWAKLSPNTDRLVEVAAAAARGRRGGGDAGQHRPRHGHRRRARGARSSAPAVAACPGRPSTRSRCGPCTTSTRPRPHLPIVGVGGVGDAVTAVELLLAGASAVQVGTATFADPRAPLRVLRGPRALVRQPRRRHGSPS